MATAVRRDRDVVQVAGPDSRTYLQGQLSQDVTALNIGESADTFVLQPNGKVDAWMRIIFVADDIYLLDVDAGWGTVVVARLNRFLLRTDCAVELMAWELVTVMDPVGMVEPEREGVVVPVSWPGLAALDLLGPKVAVPDGIDEVPHSVWEQRRIAAGIPVMGAEIDDSTIPGATGVVNRSVSFTKGCYTGQELVARIDSRGAGTPTRIVRAVGRGSTPAVDTECTVDGVTAGRVTSAASLPTEDFVALVELKRAITVPTTADAGGVPISLLAD
ncbi:MAG: hypothetical protein P8M16_02200 [Acidimicrobiales bacterium]|nr:hypothetical protein [Acidimicrobiales bacterium]